MADVELRIRANSESFEAAMKRSASAAKMLDAGFASLSNGAVRLHSVTNQLIDQKGRYIAADRALNAIGVQTTQQLAREVAAIDALAKHYDAASAEGRQLAAIKAQIIARAQGVSSATGGGARNIGMWSQAANDAQQFAYGWRAGLIALSNQFPMLIESMGAAGKAGKALQASLGWVTLAVSVAATAAVLFSARQKEATRSLADQAEQASKTRREIERLMGAQAGARLFDLKMEEDRIRREQAGYGSAAAGLFLSGRSTERVTVGGRGVSRTETVATEAFRAAQAGTARTTRDLNENLRNQAILRQTVGESIQGQITLLEKENELVADRRDLSREQVDALNAERTARINALKAEQRAREGAEGSGSGGGSGRTGGGRGSGGGPAATQASAEERERLRIAEERARVAELVANPAALREMVIQQRLIEGDRLRLDLALSLAAVALDYGAAGTAAASIRSMEAIVPGVAARAKPLQVVGMAKVNRALYGAGVPTGDDADSIRARADALREEAAARREAAAAAVDPAIAAGLNEQAMAAERQASAFDRSAEAAERLSSTAASLAFTLQSGLTDGIASVGEALGRTLVEGGSLTESLGKVILGGLGDLASQIGKQLIQFGIAGMMAQKAIAAILTPLGPAGVIAAGVAFSVLGGALKAGASKIGGGGSGGRSGGTSTSSGYNAYARTLPGGGAQNSIGATGPSAPLITGPAAWQGSATPGAAVLSRLDATLSRLERTGIPVTGTLEARAGAVQAGLTTDARRSRILSTRY